MDLGLDGKSAAVTGGTKGIGRAIAMTLAAEGANVAVCARGQKGVNAARAKLEKTAPIAFAACCDVSDARELEDFLVRARDALGGVDILVNNASGYGFTDDEAGWQASVDVDLMASVRASQIVTPWMAAAGGGAIVHISSISALEPGSPPAYAAIKAALLNHAKTMAERLAPKNIRVNCVAPGSVYFRGGVWDRTKREDPAAFDEVVAGIPFGRMGRPEEIADAVAFIASPRASWISGTTLVVDGVQHKGLF